MASCAFRGEPYRYPLALWSIHSTFHWDNSETASLTYPFGAIGGRQPYALVVVVEFALAPPNWGLPDWLTIIGFPAGVAALVMGALQLRQAREQSEAAAASAGAAEAAILRTERKLADVQLVSLLQEI